jgi:hypothetical protein
MEEYTVTVKATPMTATEAMVADIKVRSPYNGDGTSDGYIIDYPDGHTLWLNKETFDRQYKPK